MAGKVRVTLKQRAIRKVDLNKSKHIQWCAFTYPLRRTRHDSERCTVQGEKIFCQEALAEVAQNVKQAAQRYVAFLCVTMLTIAVLPLPLASLVLLTVSGRREHEGVDQRWRVRGNRSGNRR